MPYEFFISRRYMRAKRKQVFVSIITFISIFGIFLGVAALIIVLAVMNGFEEDLRTKILGIKSHIESIIAIIIIIYYFFRIWNDFIF